MSTPGEFEAQCAVDGPSVTLHLDPFDIGKGAQLMVVVDVRHPLVLPAVVLSLSDEERLCTFLEQRRTLREAGLL